jgi:GNAT superfamily N-acetyltransferase
MGIALADLPTALTLPTGVTVDLVRDKPSLEQWVRTFCAGFEVPASLVEAHVAGITRDNPGDAAAAHYYIAYLHGDPVATSAMNLAAGVAGIFAVSTLPAARRQGIGAAVTTAPLLDARARGYCVGVLEATEMGYPVYARMGFSEQFGYGTFLWRPD